MSQTYIESDYSRSRKSARHTGGGSSCGSERVTSCEMRHVTSANASVENLPIFAIVREERSRRSSRFLVPSTSSTAKAVTRERETPSVSLGYLSKIRRASDGRSKGVEARGAVSQFRSVFFRSVRTSYFGSEFIAGSDGGA